MTTMQSKHKSWIIITKNKVWFIRLRNQLDAFGIYVLIDCRPIQQAMRCINLTRWSRPNTLHIVLIDQEMLYLFLHKIRSVIVIVIES
jgi:hypothetical protein